MGSRETAPGQVPEQVLGQVLKQVLVQVLEQVLAQVPQQVPEQVPEQCNSIEQRESITSQVKGMHGNSLLHSANKNWTNKKH